RTRSCWRARTTSDPSAGGRSSSSGRPSSAISEASPSAGRRRPRLRPPPAFRWPMAGWPMAKVRVRPETGTLYLDFFYRGVRCREQTALPDSAENRRRVQALMNRISKEIRQGLFDYAATFPESPRAARFADGAPERSPIATTPGTQPAAETPSFAEFSVTWRKEMAPQWRRQHRESVDATFDA